MKVVWPNSRVANSREQNPSTFADVLEEVVLGYFPKLGRVACPKRNMCCKQDSWHDVLRLARDACRAEGSQTCLWPSKTGTEARSYVCI